MWKIEMPLEDLQWPPTYPNCFELRKSSSKKIFTTGTNRSPDTSRYNTQNSKNHYPHVSVLDQADTTVKATLPSSTEAVFCVVSAKSTIGPQFLTMDRLLRRMCLSAVWNCEQQNKRLDWPRILNRYRKTNSILPKLLYDGGNHADEVLDPYYFDKQTVSGADYHELLNTYVKSSRQNFRKLSVPIGWRASAYK